MDHSMMMGTSMFQTANMSLARIYWYIIAGVMGLLVVIRAVDYSQGWIRLRMRASSAKPHPTRPTNAFFQTWATLTAVAREASYPQLYVPIRRLSWLTPPPVGRVLVLAVYWAVIIAFMVDGAVVHDANFWERVGFRNAWVTITQLPLLYLLAGKASVLGTLAGTSHERLNWLHRWVARTMFVTASVHGWHFYEEYASAGLASQFFQVMTMGKYGVAAWALFAWSFVSGFAPLRHMCYEFFVLQHIVTGVLLLWVIYKHIPAYSRYNLWFAIAALCFDCAARLFLLAWQNIKLRPFFSSSSSSSCCQGGQRFGHEAQVRAVGHDTTIVTIKNVHFHWRAGQHLYLWVPALAPLESHPYTIACAHPLPGTCICNSVQLVVRKHSGFSKRLHDRAARRQAAGLKDTCTVFVTGPFGVPPRSDIYETLVLISASTGASFTLPLLESALQEAQHATSCIKRIDFLLTARKGDEIDYYVQRLHDLLDQARDCGIELSVHVAVTRDARSSQSSQSSEPKPSFHAHGYSSSSEGGARAAPMSRDDEKRHWEEVGMLSTSTDVELRAVDRPGARRHRTSVDSHVHQLDHRPDIDAFVRDAVETTGGETSVVVCGGASLVARTRNCVARLSDERGVHKGTGAQGIHLHVEEYGF